MIAIIVIGGALWIVFIGFLLLPFWDSYRLRHPK